MTALVQEQDQMMHTNGAALPHLANLPFNFSQNMCRESTPSNQAKSKQQVRGCLSLNSKHLNLSSSCRRS
jgi:hypothetical protein